MVLNNNNSNGTNLLTFIRSLTIEWKNNNVTDSETQWGYVDQKFYLINIFCRNKFHFY